MIREVDERQRRSGLYWDHQEFGGHYYRLMSYWQIMNALLGLGINQNIYAFSPKMPESKYRLFISFKKGTPHYSRRDNSLEINVLSGEKQIGELELENSGITEKPEVRVNGVIFEGKVSGSQGKWIIPFSRNLKLNGGDKIVLN